MDEEYAVSCEFYISNGGLSDNLLFVLINPKCWMCYSFGSFGIAYLCSDWLSSLSVRNGRSVLLSWILHAANNKIDQMCMTELFLTVMTLSCSFQVSMCGFCFLILFTGNFFTTVAVVRHKLKNEKTKRL